MCTLHYIVYMWTPTLWNKIHRKHENILVACILWLYTKSFDTCYYGYHWYIDPCFVFASRANCISDRHICLEFIEDSELDHAFSHTSHVKSGSSCLWSHYAIHTTCRMCLTMVQILHLDILWHSAYTQAKHNAYQSWHAPKAKTVDGLTIGVEGVVLPHAIHHVVMH